MTRHQVAANFSLSLGIVRVFLLIYKLASHCSGYMIRTSDGRTVANQQRCKHETVQPSQTTGNNWPVINALGHRSGGYRHGLTRVSWWTPHWVHDRRDRS